MDKKNEEYLSQYIKLTDKIKQKIESHANRYTIKAEICAWYSDVAIIQNIWWKKLNIVIYMVLWK